MASNKILFFTVLLFISHSLYGQQTVGTFVNTANDHEGYTLFSPIQSNDTYLIDNCGELIHTWTTTYQPALTVYLLENGNLLRTGNTANPDFVRGGSGGIIEMLDWDSNVIWSYTVSSTTECHHHDVAYLPNGNILILAWETITQAEALQAGRTNAPSTLWSDKIIEVRPDLVNGGGTVVWEWHLWDHLVQDVDPNLDNFGSVSGAPQLIHLNYGNLNRTDWLHTNSIAYNENLDQIILSVRNFSEIWVLDHATTTAEAAGHSGGNANKGGDLLYRWGNPQSYGQGTSEDQQLGVQHDARWIPGGYQDEGMIMVFNNRPPNGFLWSTVNVINPPVAPDGTYSYPGGAYAPATFHWSYAAPNLTDFYSANLSGALRLPNGNTFICEGGKGKFFEVDSSGNIVWAYINPVSDGVPVAQGSLANRNDIFRAERYAFDYSGLAGRTLTPQGYIESGSTHACVCPSSSVLSGNSVDLDDWKTGNNISSTQLILSGHTVDYDAGICIDLETGFEVELGATFHAIIGGCN